METEPTILSSTQRNNETTTGRGIESAEESTGQRLCLSADRCPRDRAQWAGRIFGATEMVDVPTNQCVSMLVLNVFSMCFPV